MASGLFWPRIHKFKKVAYDRVGIPSAQGLKFALEIGHPAYQPCLAHLLALTSCVLHVAAHKRGMLAAQSLYAICPRHGHSPGASFCCRGAEFDDVLDTVLQLHADRAAAMPGTLSDKHHYLAEVQVTLGLDGKKFKSLLSSFSNANTQKRPQVEQGIDHLMALDVCKTWSDGHAFF